MDGGYQIEMGKISPKLFVAFLTFITGVMVATLWFIYRPSSPQVLSGLPSIFRGPEESEEYSVYSAVIKDEFVKDGVRLLVISDRTLFYANPDYLKSSTAGERVEDMKKYHPSVAEETLRDFEAKHMQPSTLSPNFHLPVKYMLVDGKREIDEGEARIGAFHEKYPGAGGMIRLSRVGFNKERNEAFVSVEYIFCPLCGHGEDVLLRKSWGVWRVVEKFGGWVS